MFFPPTQYLVASGKKLKIVEHNELWFGTGMSKVEQLSEDAVSKHYSSIFTPQGRSEGENPRESKWKFQLPSTWHMVCNPQTLLWACLQHKIGDDFKIYPVHFKAQLHINEEIMAT